MPPSARTLLKRVHRGRNRRSAWRLGLRLHLSRDIARRRVASLVRRVDPAVPLHQEAEAAADLRLRRHDLREVLRTAVVLRVGPVVVADTEGTESIANIFRI